MRHTVRYPWWGYIKAIIRQNDPTAPPKVPPSGIARREWEAVLAAAAETAALPDGAERLKFIRLVFWNRTHTLSGAAAALFVSERTAQEWHRRFIRCAARHYGFFRGKKSLR